MLRINVIGACLLLCIAASLESKPVCGQEEGTLHSEKMGRFLARVIAERDKLVLYQFTYTIATDEPTSFVARMFPDKLKITYEYSKLDDHELLMFDYSDCADRKEWPVEWRGRSGSYRISGRKGPGGGVCNLYDDSPDMGESLRYTEFIDLNILGLCFCGDFGHPPRWRFLPLMKNMKEHSDHYWKILDIQDKETRVASTDGAEIVFSEEKGLWPIRSKLAFAEWAIDVEKRHDHFVPTKFRVSCKEKIPVVLEGTIEWTSINRPFQVGKAAAERIAKQFEVSLVDTTGR
jgi:hypothetical protein